MIKKIIDWIRGKNSQEVDHSVAAPYKVEPNTSAMTKRLDDLGLGELASQPADEKSVAPIVESATITVKAKYKKSVLAKMSKKELADLVAKHKLEVKSRATKDEMVKALLKV